MDAYKKILMDLQVSPKSWLVTGCAGFIGSNLLEALLKLDQRVVGLDNFSTGFRRNLEEVKESVTPTQWGRFSLVEGDIRDLETCKAACRIENQAVDHVLHQAALGSVPRSISDPMATNTVNITGQLNMLMAARDAGVKQFVYAASSSTYGDHAALPKVEDRIGKPLSPYAVTKLVNEMYADVFDRVYGVRSTGLRYFNVFGRRQNPNGEYAAVIPTWIAAMIRGGDLYINGDGQSSRDFCYVENAVQANLLAATTKEASKSEVYNVAVGTRTSLDQLFNYLRTSLSGEGVNYPKDPIYRDFRSGDVRHSQADITKASRTLGYTPTHTIQDGIQDAISWYVEYFKSN